MVTVKLDSVTGCKQFSCGGDAVWRLVMGCRWMLGALCRAVIMAGLEAGLSQGCTPCQISAPPARRSVWHTALHGYFPRRSQRDQPRGDLYVD